MTVSPSGLVGREEEQHLLEMLVAHARNGRAGSLLIIGEPGMGKTALLDDAVRRAGHARVLRIDGYQSEAAIPYAGLHRLTLPLRGLVPGLPPRHLQALDIAVGRADGPPPDRFLVGLGLLELLGLAATAHSTVCVIDDVHLVDSETLDVLAFVARRLIAEPLAMMFAGRDEHRIDERLSGVESLTLTGLRTDSAVRLLSHTVAGPLDPAVAAQVAHATGGNPLALIDLARTLQPGMLSELIMSAEPLPVGRRLEQHYIKRVRELDAGVQVWLLLAAADSTGTLELITAAAAALGLDADIADRAERSGLVEIRTTARFHHPLVSSAVYNSADGASRRWVHQALAGAAETLGLIELEAWHASRATIGTDPAVADQLEQVADMAARRGGLASRARVLMRSAELTPAGALRDVRQVAAAEAALGSGAVHVAASILEGIDADGVDPVTRGRIIMARVDLAAFRADGPSNLHACAGLIAAADLFQGHDVRLEQRALIRAVETCMNADRLMQGVTPAELGTRLEQGAALDDAPVSVVLTGLSALIRLPYEEAVPLARAAFDEIMALPDAEIMRMGVSIAALGTFLWDNAGRAAALERALSAARDAGALQVVDALLWIRSLAELTGGTVTQAVHSTEVIREVRLAMGYDAENVINAALMAWTGSHRNVVLAIADGANAAGFGGVGASAVAAIAIRDLADGHYRDAYDRLEPLIGEPFLQVTPTQFADFVEAAARTGRKAEASVYARQLDALAVANGSAWCRGVAERAAGLAADDTEAEKHFRASADALELAEAEVDRARTHLVYGEWLRRARRRADASVHLRRAIQLLELTGADIFLPRARAELAATGFRADSPPATTRLPLTTQEFTIAERAAAGQTNAEIASAMFISPNTVDYHLRKVFQKFGVSSRRQLADRLQPTT